MGLYVPGAARMAAASVGAHIDRLGSSVRCIHVSFQRDDLPRGCDVIQLSNTKMHGICVVVSILLAYVSATDDQVLVSRATTSASGCAGIYT